MVGRKLSPCLPGAALPLLPATYRAGAVAVAEREALPWEEGVFLASGQPPSGCTSAIAEQEGQLEVAQLHPCTAQMGSPTPREVKQITHRSNQKSGRNQVQLHSVISLHYFLELKLLPK